MARSKATASCYFSVEGKHILSVLRLEGADGKTFRPITVTEDGYKIGDPPGPLPLYNLPAVLARSEDIVVVCEGEKAADAGSSAGLLSTTSCHGATSAGKTDWSSLAGRRVVIWPDKDGSGQRYAKEVKRSLEAIEPPAAVRILKPPMELPPSGDLHDFVHYRQAGGRTKDKIRQELKELISAVAPAQRLPAKATESIAAADTECAYKVIDGETFWIKHTTHGVTPVRLANFTARITDHVTVDDGLQEEHYVEIEVNLASRVLRCKVPMSAYNIMTWPTEQCGPRAIIYAGMGVRDHLRTAIQELSRDITQRRVHAHTGWTRGPDDQWMYLHAGGAIGPDGPVPGVEVELPEQLTRATLPEPVEEEDLRKCLAGALSLLELGPPQISFPMFCAVYRVVIDEVDSSAFLYGMTDSFKTERAVFYQSSFGTGFDSRHLPASWTGTSNSLEVISFYAKDMILVIDDFVPAGSRVEVQRQNRDAERLLRAQGNRAGRSRLNASAQMKRTKYPRGMILATGETIPPNLSSLARTLLLEAKRGDIKREELSACQRLREEGVYAKVMASFLKWVAPQLDELRSQLKARVVELRDDIQRSDRHRRTATTVADMQAGFETFLRFVVQMGGMEQESADTLRGRCWDALLVAADAQGAHHKAADPAQLFLRLLGSAVSSGSAYLANMNDEAPTDAEAFGWQRDPARAGESVAAYRSHGIKVGWVDGDDIYLNPDAALKAAQSMAADEERVPFGTTGLAKRLHEGGYLRTTDLGRSHLTIRKRIGNQRLYVLHLEAGVLTGLAQVAPLAPEPSGEAQNGGDGPDSWASSDESAAPSGPEKWPTNHPPGGASGGAGPVGPQGPVLQQDGPTSSEEAGGGGEGPDAEGGATVLEI